MELLNSSDKFLSNKKIDNYYINGNSGCIYFYLDPDNEEINFNSTILEYPFFIFTAFSEKYLEEDLPLNIEDVKDPDKSIYSIIKFPEKYMNSDYFSEKKSKGINVIPLYIDINSGNEISKDCKLDFIINSNIKSIEEFDSIISRYNIEKIYNITIPFFDEFWEEDIHKIAPSTFFFDLKNYIEISLNEMVMSNKDYYDILNSIGESSFDYNLEKTIYLNDLNLLKDKISSFSFNPLTDLLSRLFFSLTNTMLSNREIGQCQHCWEFFKFVKNKKYCNLKYEGRDCGKSARNKRSYRRRKEKIIKS